MAAPARSDAEPGGPSPTGPRQGRRGDLGGRVRFSATRRTCEVTGWAVLWLRVDAQAQTLAPDNMQHRALRGTTDWTEVAIRSGTDSGICVSCPCDEEKPSGLRPDRKMAPERRRP